MTTTIASLPAVTAQAARRQRLGTMKRRATALLGAVTVVFLVATVFGGDQTWVGYVQATAEAAMVGGLADWFAVTALFRHPLRLPIPHTAIIVARKDQFGATLGEFIQETFLTPDAIVARLRAADVAPRLAQWLRDPEHASRLSAELMDAASKVADLVNDEEVHRALETTVRERLDQVPLAPVAGRALEFLIRDDRHQQVLDTALRELDHYLEGHREELRERLGESSPWWLPGAAEDRIFDRLIEGARRLIGEMLEDREHHLRQRFDGRLRQLADELQTSDEYLARGERLKHEVLAQPQVAEWVSTLWDDAKRQLRAQADDPDSDLRQRLAGLVVALGQRLDDDPALAAKIDEAMVTGATYVVDRFNGEIVGLVSGTIGRWDAAETADRLEQLLGPDLQYIRINGTVVGALAGLCLHALAQVIG
jgi:uncharacterized membrane-anchored protein YjiN (DUF445 family)